MAAEKKRKSIEEIAKGIEHYGDGKFTVEIPTLTAKDAILTIQNLRQANIGTSRVRSSAGEVIYFSKDYEMEDVIEPSQNTNPQTIFMVVQGSETVDLFENENDAKILAWDLAEKNGGNEDGLIEIIQKTIIRQVRA